MEDESKNPVESNNAAQNANSVAGEVTSNTKKKFPTLIIVVCFLIVIGLIFIVLFLLKGQSNTPSNQKSSSKIQPSESSIREAQSEASGYISSQKLTSGYYNYYSHLDQLCKGKTPENCQFTPTENKQFLSVGWTSLAHYADYKSSNIPQHLTEANSDIYKLIETCSSQKSKCNAVLVQPAILYKETKDPKVLQFLTDEANIVALSPVSDDLMIRGIEARELALVYEITKNPKFLTAAKSKLKSSQDLLTQKIAEDLSPKKRFPREACWVSLAQIELGRVVGDNQMILDAAYFLDNYKLLENPNSLYNPIVFQPCIESYYNAGNALKNDNYVLYASKLLDIFLSKYLDSKFDKILFGEGGTATFPREINSQFANSIALPDSAYTNYLLYLRLNSTK